MTSDQHAFAEAQYRSRAKDYVASAVHASGADLDQIEETLRGKSYGRVLDLGCGGGHVSYRAAPHVREVVACDLTRSMLDAVQEKAAALGLTNIGVRQAPAESLPFEDASFDAVLCRFTAHHWNDLEAGLREARRVSRPGALAIFVDSVAPRDRVLDTHLQAVELLRDPSHVRNYSAAEWLAALDRARFDVTGVTVRRIRMEFPTWTARTRTPDAHADAIRSLQAGAPSVVHDAFAIGPDGSFDLEAATIVAKAG